MCNDRDMYFETEGVIKKRGDFVKHKMCLERAQNKVSTKQRKTKFASDNQTNCYWS